MCLLTINLWLFFTNCINYYNALVLLIVLFQKYLNLGVLTTFYLYMHKYIYIILYICVMYIA